MRRCRRLLRVLEAHEAANAELQRTAQLLQEAERGGRRTRRCAGWLRFCREAAPRSYRPYPDMPA
jgi:hypothetical protein